MRLFTAFVSVPSDTTSVLDKLNVPHREILSFSVGQKIHFARIYDILIHLTFRQKILDFIMGNLMLNIVVAKEPIELSSRFLGDDAP